MKDLVLGSEIAAQHIVVNLKAMEATTQALEALDLRSKLSLTNEASVSAGSTNMARHLLPATKERGGLVRECKAHLQGPG